MQSSPAALLRLLATCHRRVWRVTRMEAEATERTVMIELQLELQRGSAATVHDQLTKLVDVLDVRASDAPFPLERRAPAGPDGRADEIRRASPLP